MHHGEDQRLTRIGFRRGFRCFDAAPSADPGCCHNQGERSLPRKSCRSFRGYIVWVLASRQFVSLSPYTLKPLNPRPLYPKLSTPKPLYPKTLNPYKPYKPGAPTLQTALSLRRTRKFPGVSVLQTPWPESAQTSNTKPYTHVRIFNPTKPKTFRV